MAAGEIPGGWALPPGDRTGSGTPEVPDTNSGKIGAAPVRDGLWGAQVVGRKGAQRSL